MQIDLMRVDAFIREVAAEEILPRFRRLAESDIREKQPGQLVTVADEEAERRLSAVLPDILPGSIVVGEEGVAADPSRLDALWGKAPVWVVDPVDGTQNFSEGSPVFATMVALIRNRETLAAWIYDPIADRMALAGKGAGASLNGARLHVAPPPPITEMTGRLGAATAQKLKGRIGGSTYLRCAAHEYLRLVTGEIHFALYRRLFPWDHAPGELIVREAGGHAAYLDDQPYRAGDIHASLLLAPDRESWEALRALIQELAPTG
jgi:fructose-1,6-bisphosphatase/inositol monophosphatase family enzyme